MVLQYLLLLRFFNVYPIYLLYFITQSSRLCLECFGQTSKFLLQDSSISTLCEWACVINDSFTAACKTSQVYNFKTRLGSEIFSSDVDIL